MWLRNKIINTVFIAIIFGSQNERENGLEISSTNHLIHKFGCLDIVQGLTYSVQTCEKIKILIEFLKKYKNVLVSINNEDIIYMKEIIKKTEIVTIKFINELQKNEDIRYITGIESYNEEWSKLTIQSNPANLNKFKQYTIADTMKFLKFFKDSYSMCETLGCLNLSGIASFNNQISTLEGFMELIETTSSTSTENIIDESTLNNAFTIGCEIYKNEKRFVYEELRFFIKNISEEILKFKKNLKYLNECGGEDIQAKTAKHLFPTLEKMRIKCLDTFEHLNKKMKNKIEEFERESSCFAKQCQLKM
jgi:hypothetical protein